MSPLPLILLFATLLHTIPVMAEGAIEPLKERYLQLGASAFDPQRGRALWNLKATSLKSANKRSCVDCHGADLSKPGQHIRTGKKIKPLSPAIEARRFSSIKKVEKWFRRNCKWTFGRPCSPQEKGDILTFIQTESWSD